jgi:predicted transcriptional regulator
MLSKRTTGGVPVDESSGQTETERVLQIEVASLEQSAADARTDLKRAVDDGEPQPATLSFESPAQALGVLSTERVRLLRAIEKYDPESITDLASAVERDKGSVSNDLDRLEEYGIVQRTRHGQRKKPTVSYERIEIDIDLTFDD